MGVRQSANCNAKSAASANPKNVTRRIIYSDSRVIRRSSQEFDVFKTRGTADHRATVLSEFHLSVTQSAESSRKSEQNLGKRRRKHVAPSCHNLLNPFR